jgi:hypothetical protein
VRFSEPGLTPRIDEYVAATAVSTDTQVGPGRLHRIVGAIQRKYRGSPELGDDD